MIVKNICISILYHLAGGKKWQAHRSYTYTICYGIRSCGKITNTLITLIIVRDALLL